MGFGGSILSMIARLKNNERPKRKPLSSLDRGKIIPDNPEKLAYKVVPEEDLNSIKKRIRIRANYKRKKRGLLLLSATLVILIFFIVISKLWLGDAIMQRINVTSKNYNAVRDSINHRNDSIYFHFINKGSVFLNEKKYREAKENLHKAYQAKPTDFEGIYMYTKACVLECKNQKTYCQSAEKNLKYLQHKFPEKEEVKLLVEIFNE